MTPPISRFLRSVGFAWRGVGTLIRTQPNARIHLAATVGVVGAGMYFHVSRMEWVALVLATAGVWAAEALNTAVESLSDASVPNPHPMVAIAKDVAAGGVLLMAIGAAVVGVLVFWPYLVR